MLIKEQSNLSLHYKQISLTNLKRIIKQRKMKLYWCLVVMVSLPDLQSWLFVT